MFIYSMRSNLSLYSFLLIGRTFFNSKDYIYLALLWTSADFLKFGSRRCLRVLLSGQLEFSHN